MRFNVLVALFVATFAASGNSFITAETDALEDNIYNSNEVARRLRGDNEVQEERGIPFFGGKSSIEGSEKFFEGFKASEKISVNEEKLATQLEGLNPKGIAKLSKNDIKAVGILKNDPVMMKKLTDLAIKGAKGKTHWLLKTMQYGLMIAGVIGVIVVLWKWANKAPPNTTSHSTATAAHPATAANSATAGSTTSVGTTTPTSA